MSGGIQICTYRLNCDGGSVLVEEAQKRQHASWCSLAMVLAMVLPEGYPDSVTSDYLEYQCWDTVQALCSYVRGMLSQEAVLRGIGVGQTDAATLSAVTAFFFRDLTSMAVGVCFSHSQGSQLDVFAKQWRLVADVLNSVSLMLELVSPLVPHAFLILFTAAAVARTITGITSSAARVSLSHHFCVTATASEVSTKEGSQETITTLIGMAVGMLILQLARTFPNLPWIAFLTLTLVHLVANILALRALHLDTLNPYRLALLMNAYIHATATPLKDTDEQWQHVSADPDSEPSTDPDSQHPTPVLTPAAIATREPLVLPIVLQALHACQTYFDIPLALRWMPTAGCRAAHIVYGASLSHLFRFCNLTQVGGQQKDLTSTQLDLVQQIRTHGFAVVQVWSASVQTCRYHVYIEEGLQAEGRMIAACTACFWSLVSSKDWFRGSGLGQPAQMLSVRNSEASLPACLLLPVLADLEFGHSTDGTWSRFSVPDFLLQLREIGWKCDTVHWKCHSMVRLVHETKKVQ